MAVGDNESMATKNAGESMAISIAMAMQRYDAGRIAQWSTSSGFARSHWMPPSAKCLRCITPAAAMVREFE
jgi:hypothetical protein